MEMIFILFLGLVAAVLLTVSRLKTPDGRVALDVFLETAVLVGSEVKLFTKAPFSVAGRVDQVWLVPNTGYVLVDTKNRARASIYPSDVIQLSIYAWQMRRHPTYKHKPVLEAAYVRVPRDDSPAEFLAVELLSDERTTELIGEAFGKAHALERGHYTPGYRCRGCGHTGNCPAL